MDIFRLNDEPGLCADEFLKLQSMGVRVSFSSLDNADATIGDNDNVATSWSVAFKDECPLTSHATLRIQLVVKASIFKIADAAMGV